MSVFSWNINFLLFFRLAWLSKYHRHAEVGGGWVSIGRLYMCKQPSVHKFYIEPLIKKVKKLLAKLHK